LLQDNVSIVTSHAISDSIVPHNPNNDAVYNHLGITVGNYAGTVEAVK